MRHGIGLFALVLIPALLWVAPVSAQAKNKKKDPDADGEMEKDKKTSPPMVKAGVVTGKLVNIYEESRKLSVVVSVPETKFNAGAAEQMQNAQMQMAQAAARRDYQGVANARNQLMQAQAQMYKIEYTQKTLELTALDDVVVRTLKPKEAFDDKGKVKKYTQKELRELKGDPKLPGYKAEYGDLATDQIIQVSLVRKKGAPAPKVQPKKKKGKDDDGLGEGDALGDNLPQVSQILILGETKAP